MDEAEKTFRLNVKISETLHKAIKYAKIEDGITSNKIVHIAMSQYLIKRGFMKENDELVKPEPIVMEESVEHIEE